MPEKPERELRQRNPDEKDPNKATYKVYSLGRLKGAIIPVEDPEGEDRWEAIGLDGKATRWRYRNHARDFLCGFPPPEKDE